MKKLNVTLEEENKKKWDAEKEKLQIERASKEIERSVISHLLFSNSNFSSVEGKNCRMHKPKRSSHKN
jgi:hypothetical protein